MNNFRENISDKKLRQFFNELNHTPNKRYKVDDYITMRRQYYVMLDEYKKHQKQHKVTVAKENRQIKSEFNNLYNLYDEQNRKKENSKKIKKLISKKLIAKRYNLEAIEKYNHRYLNYRNSCHFSQ